MGLWLINHGPMTYLCDCIIIQLPPKAASRGGTRVPGQPERSAARHGPMASQRQLSAAAPPGPADLDLQDGGVKQGQGHSVGQRHQGCTAETRTRLRGVAH